MLDGLKRAFGAVATCASLLVGGVVLAQTPSASSGVPSESFLGEQFCFDTNLSNAGPTGYGPYLRLVLPPTLSFDSATIFESPVTVVSNSLFPVSGQIVDPLIVAPTSNIVTGTPGHRLVILRLPVGSVTTGGPPLETTLCLTIQPGATVGAPIPVSITPVYQFGNTPTGANGSIVGTPPAQSVTPTVILFEKTNTAPESERPPGAVWPYEYVLTANIANTAVVNPLVLSDTLPADVQYVGPVSITGGVGCSVTATPSTTLPGGTVAVTCTGATTGTTSATDVVVRVPVHIVDTLDEGTCATETQINNAVANATYVPTAGAPQALPALNDVSEVMAKHVAIQKGVSPAAGDPGTVVTYTLNFQTTQFGITDALSVLDTLPDGIDFTAHGSLVVGGTPVAIAPTVVSAINDTVAYDIRAALTADIPAGTAIALTYTGTVRQLYESAGTPPVLAADTLTNTVLATYSLTANAANCSDGSAATFVVEPVDIVKRLLTPGPFVPGQFVTFRLSMGIPSGDTQNVVFRDFFPLPVFDVTTMDLDYGDADIFRAVGGAGADTMNLTPAVSLDAATNALILTYPNINTASPQTVAVDVRVRVQPDAFADNLFLTNIFRATSSNTANEEAAENAPVQINVRAPALALTKGVLNTNGNGTPNPGTGTPVNSDLVNADASDVVRFRLTIENRGGAPAFDVVLTDPAVPGLTGCAITAASLASGGILTTSGALGTGVTLTNGAPGNAVLAANDGTLGAPFGSDTALVDITCQVAAGIAPNTLMTNVGSATWKPQPLGTPGVETFPPVSDSATVTTASPSIVKTLVASSEAHTAGNDLAVGEIARYRLAVQVPEGTTTDLRLRDLLPNGLAYVNAMVRVTFVSNGGGLSATGVAGVPTVPGNTAAAATTPLVFTLPAANIGGSNFPVGTTGCTAGSVPANSGIDPCFVFGNVTNSDSDADAEFIVLEFNARAYDIASNQAGATHVNSARVGTGDVSLALSGNVTTTIREPGVAITKTALPTTADAGDLVTYTVTVNNTGANAVTAFDTVLVDVVDAQLTLTPGSINAVSAGGASAAVDTSAGATIQLAVATLPVGGSVTLTYTATVNNTAAPGTVIPNVADFTYTSLPGLVGTNPNPTGSLASTAGTTAGERTGADGVGGALNDYAVRANAPVTITSVALAKTLIATSLGYTADDRVRAGIADLAIGETATFRILATIPEGTTPTVTITDTVPFANGTMQVIGGSVISVSPNLVAADPTPAPTITDAQLGDGIADTISFAFGQVVNNPAPGADTIEVEVVARLVDLAPNQNTDQLTNNATVQFGPGLSGTASAGVDVVEPLLDIVKSSPTTTGQAGDTVAFTLTVQHAAASNADAQAVRIEDTLPAPAGLDSLVFGSATTTGTCAPAPAIDSSATTATQLVVTADQLPRGCVLTITYSATLQTDVLVGTPVVNTAQMTWHSIDPTAPDGGFGRDYSDSDDHSILVSSPGVVKSVTATSAASTGTAQVDPSLSDLTIGEIVTYQFSVVLPSGVSPNAVAVDQLPTGNVSMQVVSSRIVSVGSAITPPPIVNTAGVPSDGADTDLFNDGVTWTLNTLGAAAGQPAAARTLVFEVVAQVMDTPQTSGGVTVRNTASFTTATAGTINGSADVDIVEPRLQLAKSITSPAAPVIVQAGAVIGYEIVLSHVTAAPASSADAFNVLVSDTLPNPGVSFNAGSVGGTCAGIVTDASAYPLVTFSLPTLPLSTPSCTITYSGTVTNTVTPSTPYDNSAVATYDSLPTPVPGATRSSTTNTDSDEFIILGPSLVKVTTSSDLPSTTSDVADPLLFDLAIGETVTYTLTIGFPEGTVANAVLVDALPNGVDGVLEVIGGNVTQLGNGGIATSLPGTAAFSDADGDTRNDTTTFDFGTISNPSNGNLADDFIQVQVIARVADEGVNVDGLVLVNNAEFTSTTTQPVGDDASVEVVEPELAIVKTMSAPVGGVVTITVALQNTGNAPAHSIVITDVLNASVWQPGSVLPVSVPSGFLLTTAAGPGPGDTTVTLATDPIAVLPAGSIAAGDTLTASFSAALVSVPPPVNPVLNTATNTGAASFPGNGNPDTREYDDIDDDAQLGLPAPVVRKTATSIDNDTSGDVSPGDTVVFAIVIDNGAGQGGLSGILIDDLVPPNTTFNLAGSSVGWTGCADGAAAGTACAFAAPDVAAGGSTTVLFAVDIDNPLPAGITSVANQALVSASELIEPIPSDDPTPPGGEDPTVVPVVAAPELTLAKDADVTETVPGGTIVYTLSYENTGNQAATGVVLTDTVPANTAYNAAASAPDVWTCVPNVNAGSVCTLAIGALAVGVPDTAQFAVTVIDPVPAGVVQIDNTALIEDDADHSATDDESTPLDAVPGLHIGKTDGGVTTAPGATVAYTLSYWNDGDQDAAGVSITETVPANTTFNAGASTAGWICAPNGNAGATCTLAIGTLPGQTDAADADTATFAVTVDNPLPNGVELILNAATIQDDNGGSDEGSDDTPVTAAPDMAMTKTDGGISVAPGDPIAWTLAYENIGNQDATGVVIDETVPANTTFDAAASTAGWTCVPDANAGSNCSIAIGAVAAGAGGSVTFTVIVDDPLPAGFETVLNAAAIVDDGDNGPDPTPENNTPGDDTPVTAVPQLTVLKDDGGVTAVAGSPVVWTLTYENVGDQHASGVILSETVPANTTFDAAASLPTVWTCADAAPAGTACQTNVGSVLVGAAPTTVTFAVLVDPTIPADVEQLSNTVLIASDGSGGEGTDPQDEATDTTPLDALPDLTLSKSDGGISSAPDGVIAYTLSYRNVGTQDATGVVITETVPANTTFEAAASAPGWACAPDGNAGSACTLAIGTVVAGAPPADAVFAVRVDAVLPDGVVSVSNSASIADDGDNGPDPTPADNVAQDDTPLAAGPDLTLLKSDGGASATAGGVVAYTLTYQNVGTQEAANVEISETVPDNSSFDLAASTAGWSCADAAPAGTACVLTVGNLAAGAPAASVVFAVRVVDPLPAGVEQIANVAVIADDGSNGDDPTPENNTGTDETPVAAAPDLRIEKSDADATVAAGDTVAYTLTYANSGDQDAANVVITETVPANTTFVAAGSTPGWSCADGSIAGIACTLSVGTVAAGGNGVATFVVRVENPLPAGVTAVLNTVGIADDGTGGEDPTPNDNTDSDDTPVTAAPDLVVVKAAQAPVAAAGGALVYTLTYSNVGTQDASGVVLSETVPANTVFAAAGSTPGWSCADGAAAGTACSLAIGNVAAGAAAAQATFAVLVDTPLPANVALLTNTVTIADDGGNGTDPTPENNTSTDETPLSSAPDMSILKSTPATTVEPGDEVAYTLTYRNIGARDASGVVITETVPAGTVFVAAGSTAGWSCADGAAAGITCTLAVGDVAADGSSATATFVVRVLDDVEDAVANVASIADDGTGGEDPTPDNNIGDVSTPVDSGAPPIQDPAIIPATDDLAKLLLLFALLGIGMVTLRTRR